MESGGNLINLLASVLSGQATEENMERIRPKPAYRNYSDIASTVGANVIQNPEIPEDSLPAKNPKGSETQITGTPQVIETSKKLPEEASSSSKTANR